MRLENSQMYKIHEEIHYQGPYFSHIMPKIDFYHSHRFSWEITLNCHMSWFHKSPFIGPIKIIENVEKLPILDHGAR